MGRTPLFLLGSNSLYYRCCCICTWTLELLVAKANQRSQTRHLETIVKLPPTIQLKSLQRQNQTRFHSEQSRMQVASQSQRRIPSAQCADSAVFCRMDSLLIDVLALRSRGIATSQTAGCSGSAPCGGLLSDNVGLATSASAALGSNLLAGHSLLAPCSNSSPSSSAGCGERCELASFPAAQLIRWGVLSQRTITALFTLPLLQRIGMFWITLTVILQFQIRLLLLHERRLTY